MLHRYPNVPCWAGKNVYVSALHLRPWVVCVCVYVCVCVWWWGDKSVDSLACLLFYILVESSVTFLFLSIRV